MGGVNNICCTPALPEESLSDEIIAEINHLYNIGAGKQVIVFLEMLCKRIDKSNKNYKMIKDYLIKSKESLRFKGHIITTHSDLIPLTMKLLKRFSYGCCLLSLNRL